VGKEQPDIVATGFLCKPLLRARKTGSAGVSPALSENRPEADTQLFWCTSRPCRSSGSASLT